MKIEQIPASALVFSLERLIIILLHQQRKYRLNNLVTVGVNGQFYSRLWPCR